MKKVVVIGGGSGLATLLRSIRDYPIEITAVVTMTDDGFSTGRLRRDFGILPPGDVRKCIAALSDNEDLLLALFQYRFRKGVGLKGHSLGNLLISAAKDIYGNFESGIEGVCEVLSIKGKVLPSTLEDIQLVAEFVNDKKIAGETRIVRYGYNHKIKRIYINKKAKANNQAIEAIKKADYILVGPGSVYTSLIPNFLLKDVLSSYQASKAVKVYICNVSTERGETEGLDVYGHLKLLESYGVDFDVSLVNNKKFKKGSGDGYISPVLIAKAVNHVENLITTDLVNHKNPLYHDINKLGREVWNIILKFKKGRAR